MIAIKLTNYAQISLYTALCAWGWGVIFTLLFWWLVALSYGNHQPGEPKPDTLLIDICTVFAFLALPLSVIATLLGMIALIKGQQMRHAACSLIIAMPLSILLGMGFWVAVNGGG